MCQRGQVAASQDAEKVVGSEVIKLTLPQNTALEEVVIFQSYKGFMHVYYLYFTVLRWGGSKGLLKFNCKHRKTSPGRWDVNFAFKYPSRLGKNSKTPEQRSHILEVMWGPGCSWSLIPASLSLSIFPHMAKFLTFSSWLTKAPLPPWSLLKFLPSMESLPFSDPLGIFYLHQQHMQACFKRTYCSWTLLVGTAQFRI